MTDFNFTVRATDNAGAFADRNFSLTVNDTATSSVFDRFVLIGSTGLTRSTDGVTWSGVDTSFIASNSLNSVVYGNNTWVTYAANLNVQMRTANASSMAFTPIYSPTFNVGASTRNVYYMSQLIYRKGIWSALIQAYLNGVWSIDEYTSTDNLKTFNFARPMSTSYSGGAFQPVLGYDYDPVKDTWVAYHAQTIWRRTGSGSWVYAAALSNGNPTYAGGSVLFKNGLWVVTNASSTQFATSLDGQNFVTRSGPPNPGYGSVPSYQNGRLLFSTIGTSSSQALTAYESLNGGRTFTARGGPRTSYPQTYNLSAYPTQKIIATYAGRTLLINNVSNTVYTSGDDLLTLTPISTLAGLGVPLALGVRDN